MSDIQIKLVIGIIVCLLSMSCFVAVGIIVWNLRQASNELDCYINNLSEIMIREESIEK